jgi:tetratricopeptide (TPR) repeat protein
MPALERPEARTDPELFGTALLTATHSARLVDLAMARQLGEQAVKLARQLDAGRLLIESLADLSYLCYLAGEPEQGLPPGREAVELARHLGDDVLLGESLAGYLLCDAVIDPAHAGPLFTEAIACTQRSGDHLVAYYLTNSAGCHALSAGDIPAARTYLQQATQAMQASGEEGIDLSILTGWVLRQDNDPGGARSSFGEALRISRRNGDRPGIAIVSLGLACLAADAGDWHQAAVLHGAAQALLGPTGPPWEELEARYRQDSLDQVRAHLGQEQFEQAHAQGMALSFDQALDLTSRTAHPG